MNVTGLLGSSSGSDKLLVRVHSSGFRGRSLESPLVNTNSSKETHADNSGCHELQRVPNAHGEDDIEPL